MPSARNTSASNLPAALTQSDPESRREYRLLITSLRKQIRHLAPDLAQQGLCDDVIQRMWELALRGSLASFDPQKSSLLRYLSVPLRNAIRDERAAYAPPAVRTRPVKDDDGDFIERHVALSLDALARSVDGMYEASLSEAFADPDDEIANADVRMDTESDVTSLILLAESTAPVLLLRALKLMRKHGYSIDRAAGDMGESRSVLRHQLTSWRRCQGFL